MSRDGAMPKLISLKDAAWLREPEVRAIFDLLNHDGDRGRAIGGAVRDEVLGRKVTEVDFATTALPETVMARAKAAGIKSVPTGVEHGTVTLIAGGRGYQVTTLREDVVTDGRHAVVRFGTDWEADARRRDFTINALSVDVDGTVYDPVGGYPDILARRVRFIGDADKRIAEDYLRVLRFFRFHAECCAGPVDRVGLDAAIRGRHGLRGLAAERIAHELARLLVANGAAGTVEEMQHAGILPIILAGVGYLGRLNRIIDFEREAALPPSFPRRLAALAVRIAEDEARIAGRLKLSNDDREAIASALEGEADQSPPSAKEAKVAIYRKGRDAFTNGLALAAASGRDPITNWVRALKTVSGWEPPAFPLGGADVMKVGIARGPAVGRMLKDLEDWWIAADFTPDRDGLIARLQQIHAGQQ
jgi:tRNA nucleotidyltransferase/poly(A) polymerase